MNRASHQSSILSMNNRRVKKSPYSVEGMLTNHSDEIQGLTGKEKKKCQQKFDSLKSMGSLTISKSQLREAAQEMGLKLTEEQFLEMLYQADKKGQGYVSYDQFQNIVGKYKENYEIQVGSALGLTYDQILRKQRNQEEGVKSNHLSYAYLQQFLLEQFELEVDFKSMHRSLNGDDDVKLNRDQFKRIFS